MKEEIKNSKLTGYKIGNDISIHFYIHDPDNWYLTIRKLEIYREVLCKKTITEKSELARYVFLKINKIQMILDSLEKDVLPIT